MSNQHPYRYTRVYKFFASHHIDVLPPHHPEFSHHTHQWQMQVTWAAGELDRNAFLAAEIADAEAVQHWVDTYLRQADLSATLKFTPAPMTLAAYAHEVFASFSQNTVESVTLIVDAAEHYTYTPGGGQ